MVPSELPETHQEEGKVPVVTERDDIGLQFIAQHGLESYTKEEERLVRWKIDLNMMPIVSVSGII
jgi:hypothetical protein